MITNACQEDFIRRNMASYGGGAIFTESKDYKN